jgi:hypothetical protein
VVSLSVVIIGMNVIKRNTRLSLQGIYNLLILYTPLLLPFGHDKPKVYSEAPQRITDQQGASRRNILQI